MNCNYTNCIYFVVQLFIVDTKLFFLFVMLETPTFLFPSMLRRLQLDNWGGLCLQKKSHFVFDEMGF